MRRISVALLLLGCLSLTAGQGFFDFFNQPAADPAQEIGCDFQPDIEEVALDQSLVISETPDNRCLVGPTGENCVSGTGRRKLVRFTTVIENKGTEDCIVGATPSCPPPGVIPEDTGPFHFATCHKHWHLQNYADYYLTEPVKDWQAQGLADQCSGTQICNYNDTNCRIISGHKTGFCLMDSLCGSGSEYDNQREKYVCNDQGITAGCMDAYVADLPCQWIDVTELPPARLNEEMCLCVTVNANIGNFNNIAGERNKNNNRICKPITINALPAFVAQNISYVNGGEYLDPANQCIGWNEGVTNRQEKLMIPNGLSAPRSMGPQANLASIMKTKAVSAKNRAATEVSLKRAGARQYLLKRAALNKKK